MRVLRQLDVYKRQFLELTEDDHQAVESEISAASDEGGEDRDESNL